METTKILWSGLTGRTGREAMIQQKLVDGVEIVAGMKRIVSGADDLHLHGETFEHIEWLGYDNGMCGLYGLVQRLRRAKVDVIVDFSHPDVLEKVLELAILTRTPLIVGTSGLSGRQVASLYDATDCIPIFNGGNFRFKVKKFIDEAVRAAMLTIGPFALYENLYEGKKLPSETSKVVQKRIFEATGKTVEVYSKADLPKEHLPCRWRFDLGTELRNGVECRTTGFDELAHDVLEIAKVMAKKPIQKGKFYDLDQIWDDIAK